MHSEAPLASPQDSGFELVWLIVRTVLSFHTADFHNDTAWLTFCFRTLRLHSRR